MGYSSGGIGGASSWDELEDKPLSSIENIDDAVDKKHQQNTDTKLDDGGENEVSAAQVKAHIDSTSNPHSVDKSDVSLGSVPNLDTTNAVNKAHDQNTDMYLITPISRIYYVDKNRSDVYIENGNITTPYKKIKDCLDAIENNIQERISEGENRSDCKYILNIAPGIYSDNLLIPACSYLCFNMDGVEISGSITRIVTQVNYGSSYYSKVIFYSSDHLRPEKGHTSLISGNIVTSTQEETNYLYYYLFKGIEISGNFTALNGICDLILFGSSFYNNSSTILGTGAILLDIPLYSRIRATMTGNISLYRISSAQLSGTINISPTDESNIFNTIFGGSVTISSNLVNIDAFSYNYLLTGTHNLSGTTIALIEKASGILNDSTIIGDSIKDALETLNNKINEITFHLPTTTIANGESIQLYRFTVPVGKSIKIWNAGLASTGGSQVSGAKIQIYNETDAQEEYSTNSTIVTGNPITTLSLAEKDISIKILNDSGLGGDFHGFIAITVE